VLAHPPVAAVSDRRLEFLHFRMCVGPRHPSHPPKSNGLATNRQTEPYNTRVHHYDRSVFSFQTRRRARISEFSGRHRAIPPRSVDGILEEHLKM